MANFPKRANDTLNCIVHSSTPNAIFNYFVRVKYVHKKNPKKNN